MPRFNNLGYWSVGWTKSLDFFQDDDEILICVYNLFVKFSFQLVKKQIKKLRFLLKVANTSISVTKVHNQLWFMIYL